MRELSELNNLLRGVIAWIGHTQIFGVTLDIPAHFFGAAAIFYLLAAKGVRASGAWAIVLTLEFAKELYDLSALLHHGDYWEPVKDVLVTVLGAAAAHYLSRPAGKEPYK